MGTFVPLLGVSLDPVSGLMTRVAFLLALLTALERTASRGGRHRAWILAVLAVVGFLSIGAPEGSRLGGWLAGGALRAAALPLVYLTLLRFDFTMAPLAIGTMAIVSALDRGATRAFPMAMPGSVAAALLTAVVAWWLFRLLRRPRSIAPSV
jgi:hypothetical protein